MPFCQSPFQGLRVRGGTRRGLVGCHMGQETQAHRRMHGRSAAESVLETKVTHRGWDLCVGTLSQWGGLTSGEQLWRLPELHLPSWPQTKDRRVLAFSAACNLLFSHLKVKVAHSCLTLYHPMDCSPPGSSVLGILQARIQESGSCFLLQGIFPTQGLNPGLLHCRQILYCLSHQGSPRILEWVAYPFSRGSS